MAVTSMSEIGEQLGSKLWVLRDPMLFADEESLCLATSLAEPFIRRTTEATSVEVQRLAIAGCGLGNLVELRRFRGSARLGDYAGTGQRRGRGYRSRRQESPPIHFIPLCCDWFAHEVFIILGPKHRK